MRMTKGENILSVGNDCLFNIVVSKMGSNKVNSTKWSNNNKKKRLFLWMLVGVCFRDFKLLEEVRS